MSKNSRTAKEEPKRETVKGPLHGAERILRGARLRRSKIRWPCQATACGVEPLPGRTLLKGGPGAPQDGYQSYRWRPLDDTREGWARLLLARLRICCCSCKVAVAVMPLLGNVREH